MAEHCYRLSLYLQGPILSQSSQTLAFGLDATMQRYRDTPVLNGSQIRGNLRHVLHDFKQRLSGQHRQALAQRLAIWFPEASPDYGTQRSALDFDLFWQAEGTARAGTRTRIEISPQTGTVARGALAIAEDVFPSGSEVKFTGKLYARFADQQEQADFVYWFDKALQWLGAIGSQKGVGYGRLLKHKLEAQKPAEITDPPRQALPAKTTRFAIRLHLDRPFCIGRQLSSTDNRIVSSEAIPGHIIKGVIARLVTGRYQPADLSAYLEEHYGFNRLIINHARPVAEGAQARPEALPLNMAWQDGRFKFAFKSSDELMWLGRQCGQDGQWHFCPETPTGKTTEMSAVNEAAPAFQPDWKEETNQEAYDYLEISNARPEPYLLVRTAIDAATNTAMEKALFSLECIDPCGFNWCADIDLSAIAHNRETVRANLEALLRQGLCGIGKTRARATVTVLPTPFLARQTAKTTDTCWVVTLQTAARLLPLSLDIKGTNDAQALRRLYENYWADCSDNSLQLVDYFARQTPVGGDYFYHHFRQKNARSYLPEWLTTAGSVFIVGAVAGKNAQACECLNRYVQGNLPAWENSAIGEPADWEHSVHIPEHGYGEITLKPISHQQGSTT